MPELKVAVMGAGKMGGAIVRRLNAQGFEVPVWDRTRSKAEALRVARDLFARVAARAPGSNISAIVDAYSNEAHS